MKNSTLPIQLGLGLAEIGRDYGHRRAPLPGEGEALDLLKDAFQLGLTFFDTAASYGPSEAYLGKFLRTLTPQERSRLTVATKFGEHWNAATGQPFTDHSYEALRASLDRSLDLLGRIDLLQLHKTTPEALQSDALRRAFEHAQQAGITRFGASVSDRDSGQMVCDDDFFTAIQFPYNPANRTFEDLIAQATQKDKILLINRPYNMGAWLYTDSPLTGEQKRVAAYTFILRQNFRGLILTGTRSTAHLRENWDAFQIALREAGRSQVPQPIFD